MSKLKPFANESDALSLGELNIENRLDRVSIFGSIDITRDKAGLEQAKLLQSVLNATVAALESEQLPERIAVAPTDTVGNPFAGHEGTNPQQQKRLAP